jgi:hypothetical protein
MTAPRMNARTARCDQGIAPQLVHVVREDEAWHVANIIHDSGRSLVSHYRRIAKG